MNTEETERQVRALAQVADLPRGLDIWPGVLARLPQVRRRRTVARAGTAAVVALAVAAGVSVALIASAPANALAAARRAAADARTGAELPPLDLTAVITTAEVGFQPEPPPPQMIEHIEYAGPAHWRVDTVITEPFHEGTQTITQVRNGRLVATVAGGRVTITRAAGPGQSPFSALVAGQQAAFHKLVAAGSAGRCTPSASLAGEGPLIVGRPTLILQVGSSPCPSADVPQTDGPARFWLDKQTFLVLRADLRGPGNRLDQTIRVTGLRYHVTFPPGTFRLPRPGPKPAACPAVSSLPDLNALRAALASPPLVPARLPDGWQVGAIGSPGGTTNRCKITSFTITYRDSAGHLAVQLYEAPQASPAVRFPGRAVTIRSGLAGTLNSGSGMEILWWIQDGRYCSLQSGGVTAGVRLTSVPAPVLIRMAASLRG